MLREAAHSHAHCMHEGCTNPQCFSLQALKLASLAYTQYVLERIARKREQDATNANLKPGQASGQAMREVSDELAMVTIEMSMELKLQCDVELGRAGKC